MAHATVDAAVRNVIAEVIRQQLGNAHVVDVLVARDEEFEDEDLLSVTVVIDDADAEFDESRVLGLVRHLQPRLAREGETAFPVISFATDQDCRAAT